MKVQKPSWLEPPAAVAAFVVLLVNPVAAAAAFAVGGTLALLAADYGREPATLNAEGRPLAFENPTRAPERMREAA